MHAFAEPGRIIPLRTIKGHAVPLIKVPCAGIVFQGPQKHPSVSLVPNTIYRKHKQVVALPCSNVGRV